MADSYQRKFTDLSEGDTISVTLKGLTDGDGMIINFAQEEQLGVGYMSRDQARIVTKQKPVAAFKVPRSGDWLILPGDWEDRLPETQILKAPEASE